MKQTHNIKAGGIISLIILAFILEKTFPFVAIFLAITGVGITFWKIEKQIKKERK